MTKLKAEQNTPRASIISMTGRVGKQAGGRRPLAEYNRAWEEKKTGIQKK